ncbi:YbaY family lipoprotein [Shewanella intestini]|uniref:Chaperone for general secretion pathway YbaY n=1 Tax=Shewanella intestini TaxID=2017544 RepID=A0ABS5I076_9GAMM|nr:MULTISPECIES: YbaY family lipoprotein [Shewanella]MBR9727434.1 chaperone for general secretion pathway YbaY [Shewanella intestini]MRG35516.1 chaperone for general secretion pathway YbaY [Shewanella sp. XMDDZSB0408]
MLFMVVSLSGCVTVPPEKPVVVNGYAGYLDKTVLPENCSVIIAVVDLDTPGVIVAKKNFDIVRAPVPFKFIFKKEALDSDVNYGVVAMIVHGDKLIYQTYDKFPVINNDKFTTEVVMKPVK